MVGWMDLGRRVEVTAHRGGGHGVPENTLSAIRKGIESGADYAEIDVQETADGVVVLLHDQDLARLCGVKKRIADVPYKEVCKLDAGSRYGAEYAGERIPTLAEVIKLARGKIKLNIELKFYGKDRRLAEKVARLIRAERFESQCVVMSLTHDGVVEAKRHNPRLRTGLIVTVAQGNISRLEVDVLSVNQTLVNEKFLRQARRSGKEVHAWTVNRRRDMERLIEQGVDNLITDEPAQAVQVRHERGELPAGRQLLLACRYLLEL
jgi:glycerophosphoryl diester phosphodiesterase